MKGLQDVEPAGPWAPFSAAEMFPAQAHVLVVGPGFAGPSLLRDRLVAQRCRLREARSGTEALEMLMEQPSEWLLLDPRLPDLDPLEFQQMVHAQFGEVRVVVLQEPLGAAEPAALPAARQAAGPGFHEVPSVREFRETAPRQLAVSTPSSQTCSWQGMIGATAQMQSVFRAASLVARRDTTVLIQGESGTGKDLVARGIHAESPRERQPFVVINCAAIPEALLESELFGYSKGAFTGATQARLGRIHTAHGGTLFLDEIGDMPLPLQSKMLRFLEQGEVQRLGTTETLKVDCRVVAATNADLKALVAGRQFREDLYYRLAVFPIRLPALRDRMGDLEALVRAMLARFSPGAGVTLAAFDRLRAHTWPGNVRELRNVLERASLYADGRSTIEPEDIEL